MRNDRTPNPKPSPNFWSHNFAKNPERIVPCLGCFVFTWDVTSGLMIELLPTTPCFERLQTKPYFPIHKIDFVEDCAMSGLFAFLWRWSCEPLIRKLLRTLLMWCEVSLRVMYGKHDKQITLASCIPHAVDWFCKSSGCIKFSWHHDPRVVMLITELPNKPVVFPSCILSLLILESISNLCLCIYLYVSKTSRKMRRYHLL